MKKFGLGLLAVLLIAYVGGIFYFTQTTFPNTTINGKDRSFRNLGNLFEYSGEYEPITVIGKEDRTLTLQPNDIELQKRVKEAPEIHQNTVAWPLAFFENHTYEVEYESLYNHEKMSALLAESDHMRFQEEPVDAKIGQDENGRFTIEPEKEGTAIEQETLEEIIVEGISAGETEIRIPDEAYKAPAVRADDAKLVAEVNSYNELFDTKIVYDFEDREYEFSGQTLVDLYDNTPDGPQISRERARALIAQMARETDTFQEDREFTTTHGTTITIPGAESIYGWLMDVDATTDEFVEWVEQRHSEVTTPFYQQKAMHRGTDEIGNTYVEIDIANQWMYIYLNGEIIDQGPTVTGQPNLGTPTPVAVNYIRNKETDRYLEGNEPDSGAEYSSLVDFWFPINWSDVGIHNSTWRTEFGGDIYQWLGSYGCINVTDHLAETIMNHIPIGTPVITY